VQRGMLKALHDWDYEAYRYDYDDDWQE